MKIKTIRGYINLLRRIEKIMPFTLKGFNNLSDDDKMIISNLDVDISNYINDVSAYKEGKK